MEHYKYIVLDIGGTNIRGSLYDGTLKAIHYLPTNAHRTAIDIANDFLKLIDIILNEYNITLDDIDAIGIGFPGTLTPSGKIVHSPNIMAMNNFDLFSFINNRIHKPIYILNDATAAAWGEFNYGAGKGSTNFVGITLGTGIGGGIVINKQLYLGHFSAGEIGHITLIHNGKQCTCGNKGCFEQYASATALKNMYYEQCKQQLDAHHIYALAKNDDACAKKVFREFAQYLASGVLSLINIFDPDIIAIGGGLSRAGDLFLSYINEYVKEHTFKGVGDFCQIKIFELQDKAGLMGLVKYIQEHRHNARQ